MFKDQLEHILLKGPAGAHNGQGPSGAHNVHGPAGAHNLERTSRSTYFTVRPDVEYTVHTTS
jgi:hypothetical protein